MLSSSPDNSLTAQSSSQGRVLVVDDEANARRPLETFLRGEGYDTYAAADGAQALALLQSHQPDVVLTDLKMPVMGGLQFLREARPLSAHSVYIVMTAFGSADTSVEAITNGAESCLNKPLDLDEVSALVERALDKVRLSKEVALLRRQVSNPGGEKQDALGAKIPGLSMAEVERIVILRTLEAMGGSTTKAAEMLGISRRKIQYRLKEWGVSAREFASKSSAA